MNEELQDQEVVETDDLDLDIDSEIESFEAEWNDSEDETTEEDAPAEETSEGEEPQQEEETPEEQSDDEKQEDVEKPQLSEDEQKRNAAFADMRRQLQEEKRYGEFVRKLAEQNGVKPDEILSRFEERRLEQQAKEQNVPVDVMKRLNDLEQQNQQLQDKEYEKSFNNTVNDVKSKYELSDDDIKETFGKMIDNNIDFKQPGFDFEATYLRFNKDKVVQRELERVRQKELAEKKERQKSSAIPSGNSTSPTDEVTDDYVDQMLKEFDISID